MKVIIRTKADFILGMHIYIYIHTHTGLGGGGGGSYIYIPTHAAVLISIAGYTSVEPLLRCKVTEKDTHCRVSPFNLTH